ncbi:Ubiquitin-like-specific protease 1A [Bienertia sinuspersici]
MKLTRTVSTMLPWLVDYFDHGCCMFLFGGKEFMIDEYDVYDVFGLHLNPSIDVVEISCTANERNPDFHIKLKWGNDFGVGPNENIKLVSKKLRFVDGHAIEYSKDLMDEVNYKGKEKSSEGHGSDYDGGLTRGVSNVSSGQQSITIPLPLGIPSTEEILSRESDVKFLELAFKEHNASEVDKLQGYWYDWLTVHSHGLNLDHLELIFIPIFSSNHYFLFVVNIPKKMQFIDNLSYDKQERGAISQLCDVLVDQVSSNEASFTAKLCAALVLYDRNDVKSEVLEKMKSMRPSRLELQREVEERRKKQIDDLKKKEYAEKRAAKKN